jgi:hypothetical protein
MRKQALSVWVAPRDTHKPLASALVRERVVCGLAQGECTTPVPLLVGRARRQLRRPCAHNLLRPPLRFPKPRRAGCIGERAARHVLPALHVASVTGDVVVAVPSVLLVVAALGLAPAGRHTVRQAGGRTTDT